MVNCSGGRPLLHVSSIRRARRSKKRRVEEEADEHHGEFDANALREHEEFTKVKNVEVVELGRHTMETWYFSPLPAEYSNCKARRPARPSPTRTLRGAPRA